MGQTDGQVDKYSTVWAYYADRVERTERMLNYLPNAAPCRFAVCPERGAAITTVHDCTKLRLHPMRDYKSHRHFRFCFYLHAVISRLFC